MAKSGSQIDPQRARAIVDGFDLRALPDDFYDDPYPTYKALRELDPVHRCADGSWFISRHADALALYRDHRRMSSDKRVEFAPRFGDGPLFTHHTTSLVFRDPPFHTRIRGLIQPFFSPRSLHAMAPRIETVVDRMLDRLADSGGGDLIAGLAFALPVEVVCDLLGVPREDRAALRDWARDILGALEPAIDAAQLERGNQAVTEFAGYLAALVQRKQQLGADSEADVLSHLARSLDSSAQLSELELVHNCIFFLNAGHETTTNLIGNAVNALMDHPAQLRRLRRDPSIIGSAVEEFLRFESSNQLGNRRALAPVRLAGVELPEGALVTLGIGAANRDPDVFADPDCLDLTRQPNRHLAFAAGIHTCAGASLARLEGRIALSRLVQRFPLMERDGAVERARRARFRVIQRLPVRLR